MKTEIKLTEAKKKFTDGVPRGRYARAVREFLSSGQKEMNVESDDLVNAYMGLRGAVSNLGYKGTVYVRRQDGEVHLIRVG